MKTKYLLIPIALFVIGAGCINRNENNENVPDNTNEQQQNNGTNQTENVSSSARITTSTNPTTTTGQTAFRIPQLGISVLVPGRYEMYYQVQKGPSETTNIILGSRLLERMDQNCRIQNGPLGYVGRSTVLYNSDGSVNTSTNIAPEIGFKRDRFYYYKIGPQSACTNLTEGRQWINEIRTEIDRVWEQFRNLQVNK